jgi:hypothetical protein
MLLLHALLSGNGETNDKTIKDRPRTGAPRKYSPSVRIQITALACTKPMEHDKPYQRWSADILSAVAIEKGIVDFIIEAFRSASTVRRWRR